MRCKANIWKTHTSLYNDSTILDKGYQGTLLYRLGNGCAQVGGASWMWGKHPVNHQMNFWHTMNFIVDTLGASLLSECLSDLCTSFYRWHFGLPFWELFLDSFWASILGVFRGIHFEGNLFGTVFSLPFSELFLESFGGSLPFWEHCAFPFWYHYALPFWYHYALSILGALCAFHFGSTVRFPFWEHCALPFWEHCALPFWEPVFWESLLHKLTWISGI